MQDSNTNTKDNLASEYLPSENEEYMNSQMLEYFKFKLKEWKDKLIRESNKEQAEIINKTGREADYIDEASLEQDRSVDVFIADRDLNLIYEIDDALERISDKRYGYCENTEEEIGVNRLNAWPIARLTIEAQEKLDKTGLSE